jgi:hypothetical protein
VKNTARPSVEEALIEKTLIQENLYWINYQPGNGTAYRFLFQRLPLGSLPGTWLFGRESGFLVHFMPHLPFHAFAFMDGSVLEEHYVASKVKCTVYEGCLLAEAFTYLANWIAPGTVVNTVPSIEGLDDA